MADAAVRDAGCERAGDDGAGAGEGACEHDYFEWRVVVKREECGCCVCFTGKLGGGGGLNTGLLEPMLPRMLTQVVVGKQVLRAYTYVYHLGWVGLVEREPGWGVAGGCRRRRRRVALS